MLRCIPQRRSSFSEWASWIEYPNECVSPGDEDEALSDPFTFRSRGRVSNTSNELPNRITTSLPLEEPLHHLFKVPIPRVCTSEYRPTDIHLKHCLDLLIFVAEEKCEFSAMQCVNLPVC